MDTNQDTKSTFTLGRVAVVIGIMALSLAAGVLGALVVKGGDSDDELAPITVGAVPAAATTNAEPAGGSPPVVDAEDVPIAPDELDEIHRAALEITGGGTVVEVDRSDDVGEAYEVEVLTDQGEVDVALDENLKRVPNLRYDLDS
jgi:hypothetical protein